MPGYTGRGYLPPTKSIIVYRNGDAFFPGKKIVVNPRQVTTFDTLLASLTRGIEAPFGAVRRLYTPTEGHRVQRLDDLKDGSVYVAAGNEHFKKLDYRLITIKRPQNKKKEQIRPVAHSKIVVSARWKKTTDESCTLNVFTNGQILVPPVRIRIPKHTLRSWGNVLTMVSEKVRLRTGAVYRLYTLDGHPVHSPTELENNQHYVAVGAERFKALPYELCIPCRGLIMENNMMECQDISPATKKARGAKDLFARTGFREDLEHTARGQMKKHAAVQERTKQQRQVSRNTVLFSTGEGSVFNAQNKRSEMAGAAEVQEDRQLKVDLPIDQVEAKIVEEEYEDENCCASPCKASLNDSDGSCLQRSLSAGSRKDAKEREVSSRLGRMRSLMARFFKGNKKVHIAKQQSVYLQVFAFASQITSISGSRSYSDNSGVENIINTEFTAAVISPRSRDHTFETILQGNV